MEQMHRQEALWTPAINGLSITAYCGWQGDWTLRVARRYEGDEQWGAVDQYGPLEGREMASLLSTLAAQVEERLGD